MLLLNKFFENPSIIAFVSDRSVDFKLNESDPALNASQRQYLSQAAGVPIKSVGWVKQVHGNEVVYLDSDSLSAAGSLLEADAVITDKLDVPIAVRTADCLSIFIYDPIHKVIAVVHAGWKGTQQNILVETFESMKTKFKSDCEDILVVFGPAIRSCCYEVGKEFFQSFPDAVFHSQGKYYLDLVRVNRQQLLALGVNREQLFDSRVCTGCDKNYFSYRREGNQAGRMISLMMMKS